MNRQTGLLNSGPEIDTTGRRPARGRRLPPTATLVLSSSVIISFLAASAAPTPLYALYQLEWGFSAIVTTTVFGSYAVAVLVSLLVLGRVSDHVGRRPVILAALLGQAIAMIVFVTATGVAELIVARTVQGLATGAALGAIGASLLDVDPRRGALANSVAPGVGTALGALGSGLVVQLLPAPTQLVYLIAIGVFAVQSVGVLLMAETVMPRAGVRRSLIPDLAVPPAARRAVLAAVPLLFAVWALVGFYAALGPAIIREITGSTSFVLGGLALFVLAAFGSLAIFVLRAMPTRSMMVLGIVALVAGVGLTQLALFGGTVWIFFLGTAIAGFGLGIGFQAALRSVMSIPQPHERAGVLSVLYVACYVGMGLPAVVAGVLIVYGDGLATTAHEYACFVVVTAVAALALALRPSPPAPGRTERATCSVSTTD